MHRRHFFNAQPEPGKKASNRYSERLRELERFKPHAVGLAVAAGFTTASALHLLRLKQLNDVTDYRNQKVGELNRLEGAAPGYAHQPKYASNGNMDNFLASIRGGIVTELREEIAISENLMLEMESDIAGASFARDASFLMSAFAAAMVLGMVGLKTLAAREERNAATGRKAEEPPAPAQAEAAKEQKFVRPGYFDDLFANLKASIKEEMGTLGSDEAAEALLCVLPRSDVEELMNYPELMAEQIARHKVRLGGFLKDKNIDPRHLFARLGPEITDLF